MKTSLSVSNIVTGIGFITGIFGFMSGEYIISSALFAATTFSSNMHKHQNMNRE